MCVVIKRILPNELKNVCLSHMGKLTKDYKALEGQGPSNHPRRLLFSQCAGVLEPAPSPGMRSRQPLLSGLSSKPSPLRELILSNFIAIVITTILMLEQGHQAASSQLCCFRPKVPRNPSMIHVCMRPPTSSPLSSKGNMCYLN